MTEDLPPPWPRVVSTPSLLKVLPIDFPPSRIDVNVSDFVPALALPKPPDDVESDNNKDCKIGGEEGFCVQRLDSDVELRRVSEVCRVGEWGEELT